MPAAPTLTQYLLDDHAWSRPYAQVLSALAVSAKVISGIVARGSLISGSRTEAAKAALLDQLLAAEGLSAISFPDEPVFRTVAADGPYLVAIELFHESPAPEFNESVGLTFSLWARPNLDSGLARSDFLQPGSAQVAAGLVLFGPSTVLVLTTGTGVDLFTLDREVGNFVLARRDLRIPPLATTYAIDAGASPAWPPPVTRYVEGCVAGLDGPRGRDFRMRWNPSIVIGLFRILQTGGLFLLPEPGASLLHTAAPIALIAELAGGGAVTGTSRILDVVPESLTSRTPIFVGSRPEVELLEEYFEEHACGFDREVSYPLFQDRTLFVG